MGRSNRAWALVLPDPGGAAARERALEHRGHASEIVGPEDEIEMGEAARAIVADLLGHAAADPDDAPGFSDFHSRSLPEIAVELMLGLVADRAGIDDQNVRLGLVAAATSPASSSSVATFSES